MSTCQLTSACFGRDFQALPALAKTHLVDSLCSGLSLLNASASALLEALSEPDIAKDSLAEQHYSALNAYVFFLHWIASHAEQQQKDCAARAAPAAGPAKGRTKAKKAAQINSSWDWDADREKLAKAFAGVSQIDLWQLCSPSNPEEAFLMLWSQTVRPPCPVPSSICRELGSALLQVLKAAFIHRHPSMYASIHPSIHPSMHPSLHSFIFSCIHLYVVRLFVHPFTCSFICACMHVFIVSFKLGLSMHRVMHTITVTTVRNQQRAYRCTNWILHAIGILQHIPIIHSPCIFLRVRYLPSYSSCKKMPQQA